MTHASLFSGIGGPEVAAAMLGWDNAFHCEINDFGRKVLEYWFPDSVSYGDITKTDFREWCGRIDILTGGFPCQPFSYAGKRGGADDDRYLWPEMLRVISEVRPTWVVGENVAGFATMVEGGYSLTWEAKQLCSEKVTVFTDTNYGKPSPSSGSAVTLSNLDMPSNRCLFRLRLSALPIEGTASSSLPLMQTPTAVMTCEEPEKMRVRAEKNGYKNGTQYGSLESQVMFDPQFKGLLKTPSEFDGTVVSPKKNPVSGDSGCLAQEIMCGYAEKRGLLLPTPNAIEGTKGTNTYNPNSQMGQSLSALAGSGLLPTPLAVDVQHKKRVTELRKKGIKDMYSRENGDSRPNGLMDYLRFKGMLPTPIEGNFRSGCSAESPRIRRKKEQRRTIELHDMVTVCDLKNDGPSFRLSPLFTEEMMGFPFLWTTLPFLRQDGARKASKPTATQ